MHASAPDETQYSHFKTRLEPTIIAFVSITVLKPALKCEKWIYV